jgi:Cu/Ag efflux protein CusF
MKTKLFTAAAIIALALATPAFAAEMTSGMVKKVDEKLMKVTIKHEELKNLDMPSMTMVFAIADPAMLAKLKAGSKIKFVASRVNGRLTVTEVQ